MKKLFSGIKSPGSDHNKPFAPPPGPPPASGGYAAPPGPPPSQGGAGSAPQYYGSAIGTPYAPPPGPPAGAGAHDTRNAVGGLPGAPAATGYMPPAGGEDPLNALRKYDTVILVDDSGSMEMFWNETRDALQGVVDVSIRYDEDGIDIHFFNDTTVAKNINSVAHLSKLFRRIEPRRSTPTAAAISRVLEPYMKSLETAKSEGGPKPKPLNLIVLTDGAPDRGQDPEPVLVDIAKRLDAIRAPLFQLGLNFIQIGTDEEASAHLAALDDDLKTKHQVRDFVDATPFQASNGGRITSDFIIKALLGGINRRIDKDPMRSA